MLKQNPALIYLLLSALLYWSMLMIASLVRCKGWTPPGFLLMFSNRDKMPADGQLAARADRAAKNMAENLLLFLCVMIVALIVGAAKPQTLVGAQIFFFARLAYWPVYLIGIPYLRTGVWGVAVAGMVWIVLGIMEAP
jgi:uncharacterized MAPEG superfamily protein